MPKKLLIVSKDVGSSTQNNLLIPELINKKFIVDCFSQKPGYKSYSNYAPNIIPEEICYKTFFENYFKNSQIDAVVVGFSSMPNGIDELASEIANLKCIPTFAVQDFWGNRGVFRENQMPSHIFLANQTAYDLSVDHFLNSKLIITGLPKYDDYKVHANKKFEFIQQDKLEIGIFLQPFDIGPYKKIFLNILSGLLPHSKKHNIFCKPHPAEKIDSINLMKENFKGINFISENNNLDLFRTLDVLITVDSTCAIDFHEYCQFFENNRLIISCQFDGFISKHLPNNAILSMNKISSVARKLDDILTSIDNFRTMPSKSENSDIMPFKSSVSEIVETIQSII